MIFYGLLDSMWQTYAYWLMGAMSNDLPKLAVFTGFCASMFLFFRCLYMAGSELRTKRGVPLVTNTALSTDKSLQSSGSAGVWRADAVGLPYVPVPCIHAHFRHAFPLATGT